MRNFTGRYANGSAITAAGFVATIFCLLAALAMTGCATDQAVKLAEADRQFREQEYRLPLDPAHPDGRVVSIRVASVKIDGKDLQVHPDSMRARDIRSSLAKLVAELARDLDRMSVERSGAEPLHIAVSFDGEQDMHMAGTFAKGFFTGLLTLGIAGHIVPGEYTYRSKLQVEVTGPNGRQGTYSVESQQVTVKYDMNKKDGFVEAAVTAWRLADEESLQDIAHRIVGDGMLR